MSIWYKNTHRPFSTCQYYFGNKLSCCYEISQEMKYQEQSSMSSSSLVPLKNVPKSSGQNFPLPLHISDFLVLCNKKEKTIFSCIKVINQYIQRCGKPQELEGKILWCRANQESEEKKFF